MKPSKVWVLYGGDSAEREVSLRSGQGIFQALKQKGYDAQAFDVKAGASLLELDWRHPPDFVYLGFHGAFGEDGTVQGFLKSLGIPFMGSGVASSALCFHKGLTKRHVANFGVACPHSFDIHGRADLDAFLAGKPPGAELFARKWFLKAARQGSTIGIERFDPAEHADPPNAFTELARKAMQFDDYLLIEEWVEGPELTVPVVFGKAFPIIEIRPLSHFYDYQSKYTKGRTEYLCPAPIDGAATQEVQSQAELAFAALECQDYARADFILTRDGPRFLEMNTLPGMTETSLVPKSAAARGMDYGGFVDFVVSESYRRWKAGERG